MWVLDTDLHNFTEYYNSSILRGDPGEEFQIPAVNLETYGEKCIENTLWIEDVENMPHIIVEVKAFGESSWQFKSQSQRKTLRSMGYAVDEEAEDYILQEDADSDTEMKPERNDSLSDKYGNSEYNTVRGNFKIYFQETFLTDEFYDVEYYDTGIFQLVQELEANRIKKERERKKLRAKMAEEAKKKQLEAKLKAKQEDIGDDLAKCIKFAEEKSDQIECSYCRNAFREGLKVMCKDCRRAFYCDDGCKGLDKSNHAIVWRRTFWNIVEEQNEDIILNISKKGNKPVKSENAEVQDEEEEDEESSQLSTTNDNHEERGEGREEPKMQSEKDTKQAEGMQNEIKQKGTKKEVVQNGGKSY